MNAALEVCIKEQINATQHSDSKYVHNLHETFTFQLFF